MVRRNGSERSFSYVGYRVSICLRPGTHQQEIRGISAICLFCILPKASFERNKHHTSNSKVFLWVHDVNDASSGTLFENSYQYKASPDGRCCPHCRVGCHGVVVIIIFLGRPLFRKSFVSSTSYELCRGHGPRELDVNTSRSSAGRCFQYLRVARVAVHAVFDNLSTIRSTDNGRIHYNDGRDRRISIFVCGNDTRRKIGSSSS